MTIQAAGALLEGCVLALLSKGEAYGYSLAQQARKALGVSESTLYPVMRRLQTGGCLTTRDEQFNGRNRRYYSITAQGRDRCRACRDEWLDFKNRVEDILLEGGND
ncbi:MAG: PadR family transcriptional regulator [Treponema sp.]|nr:PadR family transcriptional regulator [Treponema sp.]